MADQDWWTPQRLAQLREMLPTHSASQIAKALGTTKGAVIGKKNRLGIVDKKTVTLSSQPGLKRITELGDGQCRWPTNDVGYMQTHLFCGERVKPGSPYCPLHTGRAYH